MLFNCFTCGKTISSKKEACVYCKTDMSNFVTEFNKERKAAPVSAKNFEGKYEGTFFSFLLKTKV